MNEGTISGRSTGEGEGNTVEVQKEWISHSEKSALSDISFRIALWREKKGFYTPGSFEWEEGMAGRGDLMLGKLMLVVSEAAEAAEAARDHNYSEFAEEIADIFIRLFDICGTMQIPIGEHIDRKMKVNEARPIRHGRKTVL